MVEGEDARARVAARSQGIADIQVALGPQLDRTEEVSEEFAQDSQETGK
jgi:hypothetical protein